VALTRPEMTQRVVQEHSRAIVYCMCTWHHSFVTLLRLYQQSVLILRFIKCIDTTAQLCNGFKLIFFSDAVVSCISCSSRPASGSVSISLAAASSGVV
jgi:hypothetical protein